MRNVSCLQGPQDLAQIKKYALNSLSEEERLFVEAMDKKLKAYLREEKDDFLTFEEVVRLRCLWLKYQHLKPFIFPFDPQKKIPKIYRNRKAFIIWTVWRSYHLLGEEDLERASLEAANILSEFQPPYPAEVKEKAVRKFAVIMENTGYGCLTDLLISFWKEKIFPYLEGIWEFKWKLKPNR